MNRNLLAIVAVALLAGPMAAQASIINFDMTGLSPGPTYDSVILDLNLTPPGTGMSCGVFGGLDLTGGPVDGCASFSGDPIIYTDAEILDGIFSLNFSQAGFVVDGLPFVVGIKDGVRSAMLFSDGSVSGTSVPEPGTLALFGLGLAALGFARRRRATN